MARSADYDKDIAEMYGTAEPSIIFEVDTPLKRRSLPVGEGVNYYPASSSYTDTPTIATLPQGGLGTSVMGGAALGV